MLVTAGVKAGNKKHICDDTAIVSTKIINNDCYVCEAEHMNVIGVADGVGGNAGGRDASIFIADSLSRLELCGNADGLKNQLININAALIEYASSTPNQKQMATTLTAIVISEGNYFLVHIGNTRMYVGQGIYLKQYTRDHTTYQWLLSHGQSDAAESCNKNEISACFGGGDQSLINQIEVKQVFEEVLPKCIVFTSDGVHEYMEIDKLEELIFAEKTDKDIINEVIATAEQNGSEDDKSVIIVRM